MTSVKDARRVIKSVLAAAGLEYRRDEQRERQRRLQVFTQGGSIPWSPGYQDAKESMIVGMLQDAALMELFRTGRPLPSAHGIGFDERCVEYPWLFSRLAGATGAVLDAGSVFNHVYVLENLPVSKRDLHILTLAPERDCFWQEGISYLFADLRDIPIRDAYYHHIACISTLEHVGFDNSAISGLEQHRENRAEDFGVVMRELRRILKPGGSLYVSVPYGQRRTYAGFQQFDAATLARVIDSFGPAAGVEVSFFRYVSSGWNLAPQADCDNAVFAEWILEVWGGRRTFADAALDADRAAASRAVACLHLRKP